VVPFADEDDVYELIGGIIREAARHPLLAPRLAAANLVVQVYLREPSARLTLRLEDPLTVESGWDEPSADVTLHLATDIADRFLRGEYNFAIGIARGRIQAVGDVDRLLAIVPELRPLFPRYRALAAARDAKPRDWF